MNKTQTFEFRRVDAGKEYAPDLVFRLYIWEGEDAYLLDLIECKDLDTLKDIRLEKYPDAKRKVSKLEGFVYNVSGDECAWEDVIMLHEVQDVREETGGTHPCTGPGFVGVLNAGRFGDDETLVFSWKQVVGVKSSDLA